MRCENCGHVMVDREGKLWCKSCKAEEGSGERALALESERDRKEEEARPREWRRQSSPFPGVIEKDPA